MFSALGIIHIDSLNAVTSQGPAAKKKSFPPKSVKLEDSGSDTEPEYDADPYVEEVSYLIPKPIPDVLTGFLYAP